MKLLVTGAHGLLGRSLLRAAVGRSGLEASGCGRGAQGAPSGDYHVCDLLDPKAVRGILDRVEPDWVIHTAAVTNVDLCEEERELARRVNVEAVADLAAACRESGIGLTHLSTDYVFDGRDGPYGENDSTHPISHYGALKLASEKPVLEGGLDGLVVRTLWLYGHASGVRPKLASNQGKGASSATAPLLRLPSWRSALRPRRCPPRPPRFLFPPLRVFAII